MEPDGEFTADDFHHSIFSLNINKFFWIRQGSSIGPADHEQSTINRGRHAGDALAASELDKGEFAGMEAALVNYAA